MPRWLNRACMPMRKLFSRGRRSSVYGLTAQARAAYPGEDRRDDMLAEGEQSRDGRAACTGIL